MRKHAVLDNLKYLKGQPVITVQLHFDQFVTDVNNLIFRSGTHISVYADLTRVSPDYHKGRGSIIELVVAPAEELMRHSDADVIAAVLNEFSELHPLARTAELLKSHVVRIPNSVYSAQG
jgi:uncharacterized protein with NAD-binding domain and iron-sulfur cluster